MGEVGVAANGTLGQAFSLWVYQPAHFAKLTAISIPFEAVGTVNEGGLGSGGIYTAVDINSRRCGGSCGCCTGRPTLPVYENQARPATQTLFRPIDNASQAAY